MSGQIVECDKCGGAYFEGGEAHVCDTAEVELMARMRADQKKRDEFLRAAGMDAAAVLLTEQTLLSIDQGFVAGYKAAVARLEAEARIIRSRVS